MQGPGWLDKLIRGLRSLLITDLALDPGSSNTRLYLPGEGVVLNEPSVIAFDTRRNQIIAVGTEAHAMTGREPEQVRLIRPVRGGVIADYEAARRMFSCFMAATRLRRNLRFLKMLICVSGQLSPVERRAFEETALQVGAGRIEFIEEPLAAAVTLNLRSDPRRAAMIADIGSSTVDVAIFSRGGLIRAITERTGGDEMDRAIVDFLRLERHLEIGLTQAEEIKLSIGTVESGSATRMIEIGGWGLSEGRPETTVVTSDEISLALEPVANRIGLALRLALENLPAAVSADLLDSGIVLTGGSARLPGLAEYLSREVGISISAAPDPDLSVIRGAGRLLEPPALRTKLSSDPKPAVPPTAAAEQAAPTVAQLTTRSCVAFLKRPTSDRSLQASRSEELQRIVRQADEHRRRDQGVMRG